MKTFADHAYEDVRLDEVARAVDAVLDDNMVLRADYVGVLEGPFIEMVERWRDRRQARG